MPRGFSPHQPLTERDKLKLKQRGDNLRRRQGIGSAKYAEFFFRYRHSYPFTPKTYPVQGGRVETCRERWDGIDPRTGAYADWLPPSHSHSQQLQLAQRPADDLLQQQPAVKSSCKRKRQNRETAGPRMKLTRGSDSPVAVKQEDLQLEELGPGGGSERSPFLSRDLKVLMDALRQIPTPARAALAIEGMLSKREVQYALEKFGTASEMGLSRKELAAIAVLQNSVSYQGHWNETY